MRIVFLGLLLLVSQFAVPALVHSAPLPSAPPIPAAASVNARAYGSISAAISAAHGKTLVISDLQKLSGDIVIPSDVSLSITKGGAIVNPAKYTVTIAGPFTAGLYKVFEGFRQGDIHFIDGSVKEVSPQWWGENSAASINKAINAFPKVFCPPGLYLIESEVLLNSNTHLRGVRGETVFQRPRGVRYAGKNIAGVTYADPFMIGFHTYGSGNYSARTNVTVEGITVDGNSYNSTDSGRMAGIYLHSGSHLSVIDCEVKNLGRTADFVLSIGIAFSWVKDGVIKKCQSHDNSGDGINVFAFNQDVVVTENETYRNGVAGIEVEGRLGTSYTLPRNKRIVVTRNYAHDNAGAPWGAGGSYGHGILVTWSDDVVVSDNVVSANTIWIGAITVMGSTNIVIRNNSITGNLSASPVDPTGYGIGIFAQYDVYGDNGVNRNINIANNSILNNRNGIFVRDAQDVSIVGNTIEGMATKSDGIIYEKGTVGKKLEVKGNVVKVRPGSSTIGIKGTREDVTITNNTFPD